MSSPLDLAAPAASSELETEGARRPYPQLLRGSQHRWWRPLASLAVVVGGLGVGYLVLGAVLRLGFALDPSVAQLDVATSGPGELLTRWWAFLAQNLFLASGIPVAGLAVWVGHRWRPRWVSSVGGGLRWRWLAVASLAALAVVGTSVGARLALAPPGWAPEEQAVLLLVVVLVTTPLQAAGEEYAFRGWLTQAVGSWFAAPVLGAIVAGAVSATLFALAHGTQGPWLFADRFAFGVVASILVWRTGGLEASIALHALSNMTAFVPILASGTLAASLTLEDAPWQLLAVDVVTLSVAALVLDRLGRGRGLQRTQALLAPPAPHRPADWPAPPSAGPQALQPPRAIR